MSLNLPKHRLNASPSRKDELYNENCGRALILESSSGNYFQPLECPHHERAAQLVLLYRWLAINSEP